MPDRSNDRERRTASGTAHVGKGEKVKKMVEDDEDCTDVLMQLAAVRSALNGTAQVILKDHIEHCIVDAVDSNDLESIDALNKAIEQFMK